MDPPLDFSLSYFRYNSNKPDLFFLFSRVHQKEETEGSVIVLKEHKKLKHKEIRMKKLKTKQLENDGN